MHGIGQAAGEKGQDEERQMGEARHQAHQEDNCGGNADRLGFEDKLGGIFLSQAGLRSSLADHQTGGGGHKQGRDLIHQTLPNGEQGKILGGILEGRAHIAGRR
jgi:hypothetical protein